MQGGKGTKGWRYGAKERTNHRDPEQRRAAKRWMKGWGRDADAHFRGLIYIV